ncbi:sugar phosphate nucleotidyltransferase [Metabacillus sp. 84]|uniref:sugar phosphate nucleotidyltransferase n=1 Tax=unclassified Metabacillus TaxID=2675274 RepID=UPI003CF3EEF3
MKAIIMAGGMGTRLQPLTSRLPKPMVPLLNKPVLEYVILHLRENGFTSIFLSLCWNSRVIEEYFGDGSRHGVQISYLIEKKPLGTAGCIKLAEPFLKESFLVVSGDTISNFNLGEGISAHRESGCIATVFGVKKNQTGEYGSVIAGRNGRILGFSEKPSRTEVYSEYINTGMYIFEPEVFNYIKRGTPQDISKDIMPKLLTDGLHMHQAAGYWSDIGTHSEYRGAQYDLLDGIKGLSPEWIFASTSSEERIHIEQGAVIEPGTILTGPLFIGKGTVIEKGSKIGPYAILGDSTHIAEGSKIEHSIFWHHQRIHSYAIVRGSVLASSCEIKSFSELQNGSVLGENVVLEGDNVVKEQVRIWPDQTVAPGVILNDTFSARYLADALLFRKRGHIHLAIAEGGGVKAAKLAQAFAASCGKAGVIAGSDGSALSSLFLSLFTESLRSFGCPIYAEEDPLSPSALRFGCSKLNRMGVYAVSSKDSCSFLFFDGGGQLLPSEIEKSMQHHFSKATMVTTEVPGIKTRIAGLAFEYESSFLNAYFPNESETYGAELDALSYRFHRDWLERANFTVRLSPAEARDFKNADLVFLLNEKDQSLQLKGENGDLPITASVLSELLQESQSIPETDSPLQLLIYLLKGMKEKPAVKTKLILYSKAAYEHISCQHGQETRVLSRLISDEDFDRLRLSEGVNIHHADDSWTRISALQDRSAFSVITVNSRPEEALKTNEKYTRKIKHFQK